MPVEQAHYTTKAHTGAVLPLGKSADRRFAESQRNRLVVNVERKQYSYTCAIRPTRRLQAPSGPHLIHCLQHLLP